jgi:hypothetical protein
MEIKMHTIRIKLKQFEPKLKHLKPFFALRVVLLITLGSLSPACGRGIWTAGDHAATRAEQIQILVKTPPRYERLGTVTHLYDDHSAWQEGADATAIMQDLLAEAGTMGANALLLADDTTMADSAMVVKYQGKSYALPVIAKTRTVLGQAIYVNE